MDEAIRRDVRWSRDIDHAVVIVLTRTEVAGVHAPDDRVPIKADPRIVGIIGQHDVNPTGIGEPAVCHREIGRSPNEKEHPSGPCLIVALCWIGLNGSTIPRGVAVKTEVTDRNAGRCPTPYKERPKIVDSIFDLEARLITIAEQVETRRRLSQSSRIDGKCSSG
jgi:hypothetical protein